MAASLHHLVSYRFQKLKAYCEAEDFKGWDPYDGLTSRLFQLLPFNSNRFARLAWIQLFKRSPVNFRKLTMVDKQSNAKGLGLFITGYCNLGRLDNKTEYRNKIKNLCDRLISMRSKGYSGSCWGYYFDWQARAFFIPAHTPTVVATSFAADALFNAYEFTGESQYLEVAMNSADFIVKDLNRTYEDQGSFSFSYSPLDHTQVYNASLLGARLLARIYSYNKDEVLKNLALEAARHAVNGQKKDGSWPYGTLDYHQWIDNFHTGFNLECLHEISKYTSHSELDPYVSKGFDYYISNFFTSQGVSKYYSNKLYPVDIHSPSQLFVTLFKLGQFDKYRTLADQVMRWTLEHMQNKKGYFYYQMKPIISSRIPYMRWAQSWMFYAMTYYMRSIAHYAEQN